MGAPMDEGARAIVARGSLDHMKQVRAVLAAGGVASELVQPPEGCGSA